MNYIPLSRLNLLLPIGSSEAPSLEWVVNVRIKIHVANEMRHAVISRLCGKLLS